MPTTHLHTPWSCVCPCAAVITYRQVIRLLVLPLFYKKKQTFMFAQRCKVNRQWTNGARGGRGRELRDGRGGRRATHAHELSTRRSFRALRWRHASRIQKAEMWHFEYYEISVKKAISKVDGWMRRMMELRIWTADLFLKTQLKIPDRCQTFF